ncbi:MAG: tyrosine--tRNA ligase [Eubacteriales bacterium]
MKNVFDVLCERGFIEQSTNEVEIKNLLEKELVTFYIGFDPTADSLHIGHFLQIMAMAHLQKYGHRPIAVIGGGTTMVGDPTDKNDMRKMLSLQQINENAYKFKQVFMKFLDFSEDKAIMVNNADWLLPINYVEFLRDIGAHFSVNRMLTAECYKSRMEKGLTFLEFNYMLMQAYDFLQLYNEYHCKLQFGGNDQWSNILAGTELIRKKVGGQAYGMTFTLLTTGEGKKMGKTEKGALWLDPEKTSPYEFYQYWRNIEDIDVEKCLSLLTFLPMDQVRELAALEGSQINKAKEILAYEVTKLIHGEEDAEKAHHTSQNVFGNNIRDENMPTTELHWKSIGEGIDIITLMHQAHLIATRSEGRRLVEQGGVSINGVKVQDINLLIKMSSFIEGSLIIKKGKKVYHRIKIGE